MTKVRRTRNRKHVPLRTCVICHRNVSKRLLVRMVASPDGGLLIDRSGKQTGRGAYICPDEACWELALAPHDNNLSRALRRTVTDDEKLELRSQIEHYRQEAQVAK